MLRGWCGADVVVLFGSLVDDDLSLLCCGEPLGIENLRGATFH